MTHAPIFIEFICGPPGSGKTTYCEAKRQLLVASSPDMDAESNADRHLVHCNLDPANDGVFPYPCTIDICDLIEVKQVAEKEHLGPNGSYLFCVDYISEHSDWLLEKVANEAVKCANNDRSARRRMRPVWFTMDCPGQVEFYVHSSGLAQLIREFRKKLKCHVCVTHLCDAAVATRDVFSYVSTCLLCLTSMTDIELPQVNVFSKWDRAVEQARELIPMMKKRRSERARRQYFQPEEAEADAATGSSSRSSATKPPDIVKNNHHRDDNNNVDEEEVAEYLDCFVNASAFSDEHFEQMWSDVQGDRDSSESEAQTSMTEAMNRRCGGGGGLVPPPPPPRASSFSNEESGSMKQTCDDSDASNNHKEEGRGAKESSTASSDDHPKHNNNNLRNLSKTILGVVEGYNLVGFMPLDVENGEMMQELMMEVDSAVGFAMNMQG